MTEASVRPCPSPDFTRKYEWAGYALGFGLGGFFDGILLHQVLQWHHLLSGIEEARQDIRVLILADGAFHVLMYVVTGIGLWLLWRGRQEFSAPGADRRLFANALIGFGFWHVLDSVLSHWILGIHRIRMDVDDPLFWDLLWFGLFGIVPLLLGWFVRRGGSGSTGRTARAPLVLALAAALAGPVAALPPPDQTTVMVMFWPGVTPAQAAAAMSAVDGRLVWADASQQLWAIDLSSGGDASLLYRHGAMLVGNSIVPVGCFDWIRT